MAECPAMDDADPAKRRPPEQRRPRERVLTPRRIAAVIALVLLAVSLRHLRFAREVFRHRRRLKLAFTVLVLLRQLRKS
jgi:hypothetical protein